MKSLLLAATIVFIYCIPVSKVKALEDNQVDSLLSVLNSNPIDKEKIDIWGELVAHYSFLDSSKTADYTYKIFELGAKIKYQEPSVDAFYNYAWLLISQGRYTDAKRIFNKALNLAESIEYNTGKANALNGLGAIDSDQGRYEKSLSHYQSALGIFKALGDSIGVSKCYSNIGNVFIYQSIYDSAVLYQKASISIFEALTDDYRLSLAYRNVGETYKKKGDYVQALDYFFRAILLNEKLKDSSGIANDYLTIGSIYQIQEDYQEAAKYYELSLELRDESKDKYGMAVTNIHLGGVKEAQEKFVDALHYYSESRRIFKEIGNQLGLANSLHNIGYAHLLMKETDTAKVYLEMALKIANRIESKEIQSRGLIALGQVEFERKNFSKVIASTSNGMSLAEEIGHPNLMANGAGLLAETYESMSDYQKAYYAHVLFKNLKDSLLNHEKIKSIELLESKYQNERKQREIEKLSSEKKISELETIQSNTNRNIAIGASFTTIFFAILLVNRFKLKQKHEKKQLEIRNLDTQHRLLRAQMDPHFIFNSLNSIQSFIAENEALIAEKYLIKFSELMRATLESTSEEFQSLEAEIRLLSLYIELEQLRFDDGFEFEITTQKELNVDQIDIPPMVSQPFVENAILHGIRHKEDSGKIMITYTLKGPILFCTIIDNGIGREASSKIYANSTLKHKSKGIDLTMDRLNMIKDESGLDVGVSIEDLYDTNGNAEGTRVEIRLPSENY